MLTGTNLVYTKRYNLRIVHEVIRLFGPLSRAEIARRTELTGQTVSNLVKDLIAAGVIHEVERRREGRGAPSITLAINPDGAFGIGLDLDRDHLTGVLVDLVGNVRQRVHLEIDFPTPEHTLDLMVEMVETMIERQGLTTNSIAGLGVGVPGPMHPADGGAGYVVSPKSFPGWQNVPLADWLDERLGMPILLENNATAAAIGERWYGAGRRIGTFFYVYFGSGLGGGLVLNGQPYEGVTGNAGEIGYLPAVLAGEARSMDDIPHVGMHFSLSRLLERLRGQGADAHNREDLDRLLAEEHPGVLAWIDDAAKHLTGLVLAIEYLIDPEAIFFGGRLPQRVLSALLDRVEKHMPPRPTGAKVMVPRHMLATAGADAAALGVATLPIYEVFAPAPRVLLKQPRDDRTTGFSRLAGDGRALKPLAGT